MARLGRIKKLGEGRYRDLDTGRFLSRADADSILRQARIYGYEGARISMRMAGVETRWDRTIETTALVHGFDEDEAARRIDNYRAAYEEAKRRGGDLPNFAEYVYGR